MMANDRKGPTIIMTSDEVEYLEIFEEAWHVDRLLCRRRDPIIRMSDSIGTGVTNAISAPERTVFMTRTRIAQKVKKQLILPQRRTTEYSRDRRTSAAAASLTFARKPIKQSVNRV
jgi:hypothetical protein